MHTFQMAGLPRPSLRLGRALCASLVGLAALATGGRAAPVPWTSTGPDISWVTALLRPQGAAGPLLAGTFGGGVWRSDDDGETWYDSGLGLAGRFVNVLAADTRVTPYIYAGTIDGGLCRANSSVTHWEGVNRGMGGNFNAPEITGIAVDPSDDSTVLLSTSTGMWTSRNWGNDWPDSLRWLPNFTMQDAEIQRLANTVHYGLEPYGVWWTSNRGQSVHNQSDGLPDALMHDLALWPTSLDTMVVATYSSGIYVMRQGTQVGSFWSYAGLVPEGEPHPITRTLAIAAGAGTVLAGSERGVHATTDLGTTWTQLPDGLGLSYPEVWAILVESEAPLTLALGTYSRGFVRTAPGGGDWVPHNTGLRAAWVRGLCAFGDSLLAGTAHGRLFLSPDAGLTWEDRSGPIDELDLFGLLRLPSGRWLVGGNRRVWASDDRGTTWHLAGAGIPEGVSAFQFVQPSWMDASVVYAATGRGLYRSSDAGETFDTFAGSPNQTATFLAMLAAPGDSTLWAAAYGDDIYRARDVGPFMAQSLHPNGTSSYRALALPTGAGDVVVVGTDGALFRYDAGVPHDIGVGLPSHATSALLYLESTLDLYVGLDGEGVWRSPRSRSALGGAERRTGQRRDRRLGGDQRAGTQGARGDVGGERALAAGGRRRAGLLRRPAAAIHP